MLLSKLAPCTVKPPMRPKEVLPIWPYSVTNGEPPYISLVLYPAQAKSRCPLDGSVPWVAPSLSDVDRYASV
jgi:hypothetical protein